MSRVLEARSLDPNKDPQVHEDKANPAARSFHYALMEPPEGAPAKLIADGNTICQPSDLDPQAQRICARFA